MKKKALEAQNLRYRAFIRAALMHNHGDRHLLLYSMREKWDKNALAALGFDSYEQFFADECERVTEAYG